jgi:hypothetical protein
MKMKRSIAVAFAATLLSCEGALLTAPPNSTLFLNANPTFVEAHGGTSVLTAAVFEEMGTPVADGTVVQWFTDLGRIDPETRTRRGIATANFVSDSRSGLAHVRAISGPAVATPAVMEIRVGNQRVNAIRLRANPPQITNSNTTHVIATVVDSFGNPVPNVAVFFEVESTNPPAQSDLDFFETTGPIFTDNNGEAENIFRTRSTTVHVANVIARVVTSNGFQASEALRIPVL